MWFCEDIVVIRNIFVVMVAWFFVFNVNIMEYLSKPSSNYSYKFIRDCEDAVSSLKAYLHNENECERHTSNPQVLNRIHRILRLKLSADDIAMV